MIEISRILLKLKQKAYSSKGSVCCVELDFESHQISGIYRVAEYQMKKLAVCLLPGAERSGMCLPWCGSLTTRPLKPANTRHHQSASNMFQYQPCVQREAGRKTREANAGESLIQKKPFGLAQLYLGVSRPIQPVSQRDPQPRKILFFQVHASLATINP